MTDAHTNATPERNTPPPMQAPVMPEYLKAGEIIRRAYPAEITAAAAKGDEPGTITGYASVFDVIDSYGDIIAPGAFTRTIAAWKAKGRPVPVLWQHDTYKPIGATLEIDEDDHGLRIKARLLVEDVKQAQEAHALAKANILGGLSIGFSLPRKTSAGGEAVTWDEERRAWIIHEVRLWEYSAVTFPANDEATIDAVKAEARAALASATASAAATAEISKQLTELRAIVAAKAAAPAATARAGVQSALIREAAQILQRSRE